MTDVSTKSSDVRPLTKRKQKTDELYVRREDSELQIGIVSKLPRNAMVDLLKISDRDDPEYMLDETLVYLLRDAHRNDDPELVEFLYSELSVRIHKLLRRFRAYCGSPADFEDFEQKIAVSIIQKLFDMGTDSADYAEINFGDFVVSRAKAERKQMFGRVNRENEIFVEPRDNGDGDKELSIEYPSNEISAEERLILREGIAKLPSDTQLVVALLLDGWQIESKDEGQVTISKYLNKSSRTIRNWLSDARTILAGYEGGLR